MSILTAPERICSSAVRPIRITCWGTRIPVSVQYCSANVEPMSVAHVKTKDVHPKACHFHIITGVSTMKVSVSMASVWCEIQRLVNYWLMEKPQNLANENKKLFSRSRIWMRPPKNLCCSIYVTYQIVQKRASRWLETWLKTIERHLKSMAYALNSTSTSGRKMDCHR